MYEKETDSRNIVLKVIKIKWFSLKNECNSNIGYNMEEP